MIRFEPADWSAWEEIRPLAERAWSALDMADHLDDLLLCADDLDADERPWLRLASPREAVLFCHPGHFHQDPAAGLGGLPSILPWEMPELRREDGEEEVSTSSAGRFLHHQMLALRDLATGVVRPSEIPDATAVAYQEAWAVTIDGRLRGLSLPGLPAAERRRRFFRTFSAGGVLQPRHWDVFHVLWELEEPDHGTLLDLAERLPGGSREAAGED